MLSVLTVSGLGCSPAPDETSFLQSRYGAASETELQMQTVITGLTPTELQVLYPSVSI